MIALAPTAKSLVFCEYQATVADVVDALKDAGIHGVVLTGNRSMAARQRAVDAFQQNADCRVFVATTAAAGVGLTLTAGRNVFFASLPWTPAAKHQAEDRANRIGQTALVTVFVPIVADTIDEQIHALLQEKKATADQVVDGRDIQRELARRIRF